MDSFPIQAEAEEEVYISYQLFGNEVRTDPFRDSGKYVQEMATAKILSNLTTLVQFFSGIEPVTFAFCGAESGSQLAVCQADFASAFALCPDPAAAIGQDKFVDYNTALEADRCLDGGTRYRRVLSQHLSDLSQQFLPAKRLKNLKCMYVCTYVFYLDLKYRGTFLQDLQ